MTANIAFLGPRGTFSEDAARRFSPTATEVLCDSIEDVFTAVIRWKAEYGILPVENSLEGSVSTTLEMLLKTEVNICSEIVLDINHFLLALPGTRLDEVREVLSHPHALAQCRGFLGSLKEVKTRNFPSTAEAAREVASKKLRNTGAIAPKIAAKIYGLEILGERIQDQKRNQTRFFVIAGKCPSDLPKDKTSIVIGLKYMPGALYSVLGFFANEGVNLTKIESRPTRKSLGDYIFYIDFEGDKDDPGVRRILEEVKAQSTYFKVLGSYSSHTRR